MATLEVPVLIVGGGPVGLCSSLLLSRHGVPSLLVERHPGTSIHPRARGVNMRTMEFFRVWGVEDAVRAAGSALVETGTVIVTTTLAGAELSRITIGGAAPGADDASPARACQCAQDALEPVLLAHARTYGHGTFRFHCALEDFTQDAEGVTAMLRDRQSGETTTVRARYLIAADGASSGIRATLGVPVTGPGVLRSQISILCRADLTALVAHRPAILYRVNNPEVTGVFMAVNLTDRWDFVTAVGRGERTELPTPERCREIIRMAAGVRDLDVEILQVLPWNLAAQVAEQFRTGRVFLMGDAAHVIPPTGGYGMNTGVADAHNLAWKLTAVLGGWAGPALLDSYDTERLPAGCFAMREALLNAPRAQTPNPRPEQFSHLGMALGISYTSDAVIPDGTAAPAVANPVTDYLPTARPGHRAPHVWLARDGERVSTIDLYDTAFTLLAGAAGRGWCAAADQVARSLGVPLRAYRIGEGDLTDPDGRWAPTYGVAGDGAVLVRPDGYVAWRAQEGRGDLAGTLDGVLRGVLGRRTAPAEGSDSRAYSKSYCSGVRGE
jgi:2-polyprenyl-6-methoxyphenol hydroxylase-like FAD-dependent oxidoreductase